MLNHEPMGKIHVSAIKIPDVSWVAIARKWWVAGMSTLSHTPTPPGNSLSTCGQGNHYPTTPSLSILLQRSIRFTLWRRIFCSVHLLMHRIQRCFDPGSELRNRFFPLSTVISCTEPFTPRRQWVCMFFL